MGIVVRQSLKGAFVQYIGVLIGYVNLLYIIPYFLEPEENGLLRFILESATFFALFAQIGIPNAIPRFGPEFKALGKSRTLEKFALVTPLFSVSLFIFIYLLFFRQAFNEEVSIRSPLFLDYEWVLIPIGLFVVYSNILENLAANYLRITVPKIFREVVLRVGLAASCILYYEFGMTLSGFYGLVSITYFIVGFFLLIYFLHLRKIFPGEPKLDAIKNGISKGTWKSVGKFLSLIVISGIGTNLVNKLDIFMVSSQIGLTENAIYATAFLMTMVIEIPSRSFQQIMAPIISEAIYTRNVRKIAWAYKKSSVGQSVLSLIILTGLLLNAAWIYDTMPDGELYKLGIPLIFLLGISKIFDAFTGINGLILANSKYYHVGIYFTIGLAILAIFLNNLLIPEYQLQGVAFATAISIFLYNFILSLYVWIKFKIHPFSRASFHFGVLFLMATGFIVIQNLMPQSVWVSLLLSAIYLIVTLAYMFHFPVIKEARQIMRKYVIKYRFSI